MTRPRREEKKQGRTPAAGRCARPAQSGPARRGGRKNGVSARIRSGFPHTDRGNLAQPQSREQGFFYGHPQNRFWPLLARLLGAPVPQSVPEKKALILTHGLALWDTIESCTITGASDASIRDVVPADIAGLARKAPIRRVLCNGATAYRLYEKYSRVPGLEAVKLPSTSPANAAWTMDKLAAAWGNYLGEKAAPGAERL